MAYDATALVAENPSRAEILIDQGDGDDFLAEQLRPELFGMVDPPLRAARVNRFPFLIVFEHTETATEVVGVFHTASDPNKWRKRKG